MSQTSSLKRALSSQIILVTGATSGVGAVTALELARLGATVVLAGRNEDRCQETVESILVKTGNEAVDYLIADLSSQSDIRRLAAEFQSRYRRLDVLVNNAGAYFFRRQESIDGLEMTLALNHLSYFLLTNLLLDTLQASAPARVVNVSSSAHYGNPIDFDDLGSQKNYGLMKVYGRSKFANILFTYELARRMAGTGVTANALHPGFVRTNIARNNGWYMHLVMPLVLTRAISPEEGARTSIYLASSPDVIDVTGKFFIKCQETPSDPATYNEDDAQRLWEISAALTNL
ncbi:MAG: SDR family oxidoreductase [Anaerolineales bacterium]|jgi:NAD(P)-dependent dehydrogenase (short-subunit alcohol dehydrogenase family)